MRRLVVLLVLAVILPGCLVRETAFPDEVAVGTVYTYEVQRSGTTTRESFTYLGVKDVDGRSWHSFSGGEPSDYWRLDTRTGGGPVPTATDGAPWYDDRVHPKLAWDLRQGTHFIEGNQDWRYEVRIQEQGDLRTVSVRQVGITPGYTEGKVVEEPTHTYRVGDLLPRSSLYPDRYGGMRVTLVDVRGP